MHDLSGSPPDLERLAAEVVERFLPRLRVFALRRLRVAAEADDAAQETLRRVLVALREGRVLDLQALPGYVFETARHVCAHITRHRDRATRAQRALGDIEASRLVAPDPLSTLITDQRARLVREALSTLPDADRELLRLTHVEGLDSEAIAERLGTTAGNIRVRRHRLHKQLAERLGVTALPARAPEGEGK